MRTGSTWAYYWKREVIFAKKRHASSWTRWYRASKTSGLWISSIVTLSLQISCSTSRKSQSLKDWTRRKRRPSCTKSIWQASNSRSRSPILDCQPFLTVQTLPFPSAAHRCTRAPSFSRRATTAWRWIPGRWASCFTKCSSVSHHSIASRWKTWLPRLTMVATNCHSKSLFASKRAFTWSSACKWMKTTGSPWKSYKSIRLSQPS